MKHDLHRLTPVAVLIVALATPTRAGGLRIEDERSQQMYDLPGSLVGVKADERMTLEGARTKNGRILAFEARSVKKDLGPCHH